MNLWTKEILPGWNTLDALQSNTTIKPSLVMLKA
jgi:hypothetical protein